MNKDSYYNRWEDLPEPEQKLYMQYLFGECEYFAYALHKEFGYNIYRVMGEDEDGNEMPVHVFCIDGNGNYVDIRGVTDSIKDFLYPYEDFLDSSDPYIFKHTPSQCIIDRYEEQSIKTAREYILHYPHKYNTLKNKTRKEFDYDKR